MACKQGIREAIEESKEYYRKLKKYDPHRDLWKHLIKKEEKDGFESFTEEEKTYVAVNVLNSEVYNGGIHQFFSNSSGELYAEALRGLTILKAENSLSLLKRAAKILFSEVDPPKDRQKRWQLMKQYPEDDSIKPEWIIELEEVDRNFWKDPDKLGELLTEYAEATGLIKPFEKSK